MTASRSANPARLCDLKNNQEADFFAQLSAKEAHTTRDGKPYVRVGFRDAERDVQFPIWSDSPWYEPCLKSWNVGDFYKLRAAFRETSYGPQLEIRRVRPATDEDAAEGFDRWMLLPRSRRDAESMYAELCALIRERIADEGVRRLVLGILEAHRPAVLRWPASLRHHHAYLGGFVEHALSVVRTADFLATKYRDQYPDLSPPLDADLVLAGAVLHDIGKLRELDQTPAGAARSIRGSLLGHVVLGRDMVREAAADPDVGSQIAPEKLLRLEHILVSHERQAEWGGVRPAMTPEALLVQAADDLDARFDMLQAVLSGDKTEGPFTSSKNLLQTELFRGETAKQA
ncbi:MAG: nucleotide-binding protein [Planctomycetota bacterium]|nr:MAG: nucleotide-binding protein [Planctomycetota bacterium]